MERGSIAKRVEDAIERQAGVHAAVEEHDGRLVLSGRTDSAEARQAAEDVAAREAGGMRIDNDLEVEVVSPTETSNFYAGEAPAAVVPDTVGEIKAADNEIEGDFQEERDDESSLQSAGVDTQYEQDTVYSPPTDPVLTTDEDGNPQVLGGFSGSSMDSVEVARSASDNRLGDEAIADAIRRELREDAAATDLRLEVLVDQGVVRLRGRVLSIEDGEHAQEVAARVPGVVEVVDELEVDGV